MIIDISAKPWLNTPRKKDKTKGSPTEKDGGAGRGKGSTVDEDDPDFWVSPPSLKSNKLRRKN